MAVAARALGHDYIALTDHGPRLTVAHGLDAERLLSQLEVVERMNEEMAPFRILTGIEVDILEDGSLDQDDELLDRLDVVVASVHSKLSMDPLQMTARMIRAIKNPLADVLGHCTGRQLVGTGRPPSKFNAEAVFAACARYGHGRRDQLEAERRTRHRSARRGVAAGCVVTIDTDSHAPEPARVARARM